MLIKFATEDQARAALENVNTPEYYSGNLDFRNFRTKYRKTRTFDLGFTLRVNDSKGPGSRRAHSGRRTVNASWEAHRDFMRAMFEQCPEAHIQTHMATYKGWQDFERKFPDTAYTNVGSRMYPMYMSDLTNHDDQDQPTGEYPPIPELDEEIEVEVSL